MTFSDGERTIRYASTFCVNHPEREGDELCVHCGQWFCKECMSVTHKYLCKRCALSAEKARGEITREKKNAKLPILRPFILGGIVFAIILLARMGFMPIILIAAFFLVFMSGRGRRRNIWGAKQGGMRQKNIFSKHGGAVTQEQLNALLRIGGGRLTARKLSAAANVSESVAKKFLDKQVLEDALGVEAGDTELIYFQK